MNYGFIPDSYNPEDYVLGGRKLPSVILQPTGQWDNNLPEPEIQRQFGLETSACVTYGILNGIEILMNRLFGVRFNKSERYIAILSETTLQGNSPNKVAKAIRDYGVIDEIFLPFTKDINTWEKYYSPSPMTKDFIKIGRDWLKQYEFKHEWVFKGGDIQSKQRALIEGLKYSPIGVSVEAWNKEGEYYVKNTLAQDNHWVTIYGYKIGEYWKIFDHYNDTYKKLSWNYNFGFAKRYYIGKIEYTLSWFKKLLAYLKGLIINQT